MPSVEQIQTYVPTLFKWTQDWGNHVCVAGSFDAPVPTWSPIEMPKNKDNIHEVTLDLLPDKKYFFKFVIDGNWVLDQNTPSCPDSSGNWNHEVYVELPPPPPAPEETKEEVKEEMKEEVEEEMKEEVNEEMREEVKEEMKEEIKEEMEEEVKEEVIVQQEIVVEEHKEEVVMTEEVIVTEEKHQEDQVIIEDHKEEHHHDHQIVAEDHQMDEDKQHQQEEQVVIEDKEQHHHQEDHHIVAEDHQMDEDKQHQQEEQVVEDKEQHHHQEDHHIVAEDQQEEQVVVEEKEQHQHQEHVVAEDHQMDENNQQHQEQELMVENKEQQNQQQEDHQVVEELEELNRHHHEEDQKEPHHEDQIATEINTTEQSRDDTFVTNESIETETIINETMVEQPELSSIIKETIIESDNDKLSAEHVAKETYDESMANETLHTPQNDTEPINVSISHENVEVTEISEGLNIEQSENLVNEFKVTEETSSTVGEKYETVVSSTTETEKPIESPEIKEEVYEPERETINENEYDDENVENYDYENERDLEGAEDNGNIVSEILTEETLKEVLLNNTWAKDDSNEDTIPSSWTESHMSQSVIWPDDTNLEWSDINKDETTISKEIETTEHVSEETRVTEITSTNVKEEVISREIPSTVLVEETITGQVESIVEEISTQSIVESHIEHKTKEFDETGINKVSTSEVNERTVAELSFEKPESSATADQNMPIPTTVVAAPAVEQHGYLDEEIIPSKASDKPKLDDVLKDNISRKIISISPSSTSSPGESTRNADMYTHNITVATNTSTKETVNIKSKHKKPVVEITSREILIHDGEEEKLDLNDIAYLVTSVATTFTLGIISIAYKSVFRKTNQ